LLIALEILLSAMNDPLSTIAATTNPAADFCASRTTLHHFNALLDLCQALFEALEPLANSDVASTFVPGAPWSQDGLPRPHGGAASSSWLSGRNKRWESSV
jgi:hypothetical protein